MATDQSIRIPSVVWFDPTDESPSVSSSAIADIQFRLVPGESTLGPSIAVLGTYKLGWPYLDLYGDQIPKPLLVVAVAAATGRVYVADLNVIELYVQDDAILLDISDEQANAPGPVSNRLSKQGWFNADLAALLDLPPDSGFYHVFVWLDDLVTPVRTVQVPANPRRAGSASPSLFQNEVPALVSVRKSPSSPSATDEIATDLEYGQGTSFRVYGTVPSSALTNPPSGGAPDSPVLSVLAFSRQQRTVAWSVAAKAYDEMKSSATPNFDFDPFELLKRPQPPENIYVVTVLGTLVNQVLPILTDYQISGRSPG